MADGGHTRATVNVAAVSVCREEGLAALRELQQGHLGIRTRVIGARWSQFLVLLQATPIRRLRETQDDIRIVLRQDGSDGGSAAPGRRRGRHRRARDGASADVAGRLGVDPAGSPTPSAGTDDDSSWRIAVTR
ncbi:hypothetical protein ACR9E3_10090 [Actinomycetospora sp. C-140]